MARACKPKAGEAARCTITLVREYVVREPVAPPLVPASSGFALNLGPPPADADKQEAPVVEEFRGLTFKGVADELEKPSQEKKSERVRPEAMEEDACQKNCDREQDGRDAEGVAEPVHAVLMARAILRDPLLVGAVAQHAVK
jgi:hypothetical protein